LQAPPELDAPIFLFDNAISTTVVVVMRAGTLCAALLVWRSAAELQSYYTQKARRVATISSGTGEVTRLPDHVQLFVRTVADQHALATCRTGTRMAILRGGGSRSGRLGGAAQQQECFLQLSECLTSIRWSWTDYLLIDEITDIRPSVDKPLHFVLMYSQVSTPADRTLTLVCKTLKHAQQWVRTLRLLRQAYARGWGVPTSELSRLKSAFKVASSGRETLSLAQQQTFFACLNRYY